MVSARNVPRGIKMALFKSSKEFLVESLENYESGKINLSLLHAVISIELLLKYRLFKIHPNLIYKDLDRESFNDALTVRFCDLPQRLLNMGINISLSDKALLLKVAKWRNDIAHHLPKHSQKDAKLHLSQVYDFYAKFIKNEKISRINRVLPIKLYKIVKGLFKKWHEIVKEAQTLARKGQILVGCMCPDCIVPDTLTKDDKEIIFCHLCKQHFVCSNCPDCNKTYVCREEEIGEPCYACIEDAGDAYISNQIDILRGK